MTDGIADSRRWTVGAKGRRRIMVAISLLGSFWGSAVAAPQLLAFPYRAQIGGTTVYSETPFAPRDMQRILARSDALTRKTGVTTPAGTRIFLTDGGLRWNMLALSSRRAFAFARPITTIVSDAVVFNRADPAKDMIFNGSATGRRRKLSGVIAHERTHIIMERAIGLVRALSLPVWQREGYADFIAQESGLTAAEYARLKGSGSHHPGIAYYEGRQRIEAMAKTKGGTIIALFPPATP